MPDPGDRPHNVLDFTWRICSLLSDWLFGLPFKRPAHPVKYPSGSWHCRLIKGRQNHRSSLLDLDEPIEISSSDSDFDLSDDEVMAVSPPEATRRRLDEGSFRKLPASFENAGNNGRGSSNGDTSWYRVHGSRPESGPSTSYGTRDDFRFSKENDGDSTSKRIDENLRGSNLAHSRKLEHEQKAFKRTLPPTFNSSGPHAKQSSFRGNLGSNRSGENGGFYRPVELSSASSKSYGKDGFSREGDDDLLVYDNNRPRILPQSLMHGRSGHSAQYGSSSDPLYNAGAGEERVSGDERSMYQAVLQGLNQQIGELDLPVGLLSVTLLRHQKMALAWMVEKESKASHCLGGILADDQGLGKTISTIALILKQRSLQEKSQSEEHDSHHAEALDLDDDGDDSRGRADIAAKNSEDLNITECKSEDIHVDNAEPLNLDDVDVNGSLSATTVKKKENLDGAKSRSGASSSHQIFQRTRPAAGTLIVCPATVLRQWARELDDKVAEESKLSVLVYHGGNRTKDVTELAKYDVVLTTYSIVGNEVPKLPDVDEDENDQKVGDKYGISSNFYTNANKKRKQPSTSGKKGKKGRKFVDNSYIGAGPLAKVSWFRVVLEAQTIKNHRTQTARACSGLRAKRRWCLSGTPIQNSIVELYSYFRFLRHEMFCNYKEFCQKLKLPISRDPNMGYKKLQAILKTLLLRRTKETLLDGKPIISLPPKVIEMKSVIFTAEERTFYAQLEAESRSQFKAYAAAGTVNQNYANILLMILRLRQACDHPLLVKGFELKTARRTNMETARKLRKPALVDLLNRLEASAKICLLCSDPAEDAVITICGHVFCYQCVADYITGDDNMCPGRRCKEQLSDDVLFSETTLRSCLVGDIDGNLLEDNDNLNRPSILSNEYSSSKIKAALGVLMSHHKFKTPCIDLDGLEDSDAENSTCAQVRTHKTEFSSSQGPIKTIFFSQWTRMLDLFEVSLDQNQFKYRRLDGSMTLSARDRAVREFNTDPEVTVMLMSLKAGNLGLNMVAACHVILLDLWWNPTTEDQAIDRAHRIGQTRPVTVFRITVKDTVEDRILALQEEKRKMVASAFGDERTGGHATRLTIDDLNYIFLGSRAA